VSVETGLLEAVRDVLAADAAFGALVGGRIYAYAAPEEAAFPCAVLSVPDAALPDDAYTPTLDTLLDVMIVGRGMQAVMDASARARALLELPLSSNGVTMADLRHAGTAFYDEREGRDRFYYGTTRLVARYTED
jgi:hypothetical protein